MSSVFLWLRDTIAQVQSVLRDCRAKEPRLGKPWFFCVCFRGLHAQSAHKRSSVWQEEQTMRLLSL